MKTVECKAHIEVCRGMPLIYDKQTSVQHPWQPFPNKWISKQKLYSFFPFFQETPLDTSSSSKSGGSSDDDDDASPKKSPSLPAEISLSAATIASLETMMMQGDLLEVSLDESQHMWRLLQATEPRRCVWLSLLNCSCRSHRLSA
jgi:hypothetical protein